MKVGTSPASWAPLHSTGIYLAAGKRAGRGRDGRDAGSGCELP